jgi:hypothetical protein
LCVFDQQHRIKQNVAGGICIYGTQNVRSDREWRPAPWFDILTLGALG